MPDDALQHVADQAEEQERLKGQFSCRQLAQMTAGGALGRVLAQLGARFDAMLPLSESHCHLETLLESFEQQQVITILSGETLS